MPINVIIGDRNYRIRIEPEHEGTVRTTVRQINDQILDYKTQFAGKDMQDYIAMVLLWFATNTKADQSGLPSGKDFSTKIDELEASIDRALQKNPD